MKKPLGKTEITGLILLALLIAAITGCALLVKDCRGIQENSPEHEIVVLDTLPLPAETQAVKKSSRKSAKKPKKTKKKNRKKTASKKAPARTVDPFGDTIPRSE